MNLKNWISINKLKCSREGNVIDVPSFGKLLLIKDKNGILIDEDWTFKLEDEEYDFLEENKDIKYLLFCFGNRYYYCPLKESKNDYNELVYKPDFIDFMNIGEYQDDFDMDFVNLGIHTGYELLNGSGEPESWVAKTKFLKQQALASIDKNTLGGALALQMACDKKGIKSIIGYTARIAHDYSEDKELQDTFEVILYVKNYNGWRNLLKINRAILVDYDKFCPEEILLENAKDLYCVISKESYFNFYINKFKRCNEYLEKYQKAFGKKNIYYQLDFTEMTDDTTDMDMLKTYAKYFKDYSDKIKPIYIPEAYYVEKIDYKVKEYLNGVSRHALPHSESQFFKDVETILNENEALFENEEYFDIFLQGIRNTKVISDNCNFKIEIGNAKIPRFEVDNVEEFYFEKLSDGFQRKVLNKFSDDKIIQKYLDRMDEENNVIVGAGFIDYFLILWDVIDFCKKENILVGVGRGSVGGSLVAYLLDIIEIDPIEYDLLFERFLNKTRVMPEEKYEVILENKNIYLIPKEVYEEIFNFEAGDTLDEKFIEENFSKYKK